METASWHGFPNSCRVLIHTYSIYLVECSWRVVVAMEQQIAPDKRSYTPRITRRAGKELVPRRSVGEVSRAAAGFMLITECLIFFGLPTRQIVKKKQFHVLIFETSAGGNVKFFIVRVPGRTDFALSIINTCRECQCRKVIRLW